uniref:Sema domain-containing protein n=1 Tax=Calidris pygmaea TaxID=425635 RepID=A0A8C3PMS4_9CHAR
MLRQVCVSLGPRHPPFAPARGPPPDPDPLQPGQRLPLRHLPPARERGGAVRGGAGPGAGPRRRHPRQHPCQSLGEQQPLLGSLGEMGGIPSAVPQFPRSGWAVVAGLSSCGRSPFPPQITWGPTAEKTSECTFKKKSQETECFNFIRVLVALNQTHLYVCGTYAFSPACTYIVSVRPPTPAKDGTRQGSSDVLCLGFMESWNGLGGKGP